MLAGTPGLVMRVIVLVCQVFASSRGVALADETATSDEDEEESKSNVFLTLLIFYGVVTGIVLAIMMVCAAVPFLCRCYCCTREEENGGSAADHAATPDTEGAGTTPAVRGIGDEGSCHFKEVARVVCVTLCWPLVVVAALCTALIEVKAAWHRCMAARRHRRRTAVEENSSDGGSMAVPDPGATGVRNTPNRFGMAVVVADGLGVITPALTTANSTFVGARGGSSV